MKPMQRVFAYFVGAAMAIGAGGCGEFEDPTIVLDLRVLAMSVEPPEIVSPIDPDNPTDFSNLTIADVEVCALVADPGAARGLQFNMTACAPNRDLRCNEPDRPFLDLGAGRVEDPDTANAPVRVCATLPGSLQTLEIIRDAVSADSLLGFGGVSVLVEMYVQPDGGSFDEAIFAAKRMSYAAKIPAERVANSNPTIESFETVRIGREEDDILLPLARCAEVDPPVVNAGEILEIMPIEPEGVREDYVVPTFDGGTREFTENLTYSWFATHGSWSSGSTGGPKDFAGNIPLLETEWTAPSDPAVIGNWLDVSLWVVQRDERGGASWRETCVRVLP